MKNFPLNRLWFQFSLVISLVVIIAAVTLVIVSYLLRPERPERPDDAPPPPEEQLAEWAERFQRLQTRQFLIIAVSGSAMGIAASVWMSRRMTAPLEELAEGAQAIGSHNLSHRVSEQGSFEVRSLARSFNKMAADLEDGERLRQNLLADVAHELRTPLTVLQGNLRAMLDDVYAMDKAEVAHLYDQTRHLIGLVNELHELAQAEAKQLSLVLEKTNIMDVVDATVSAFEPLAEAVAIELQIVRPDEAIWVCVDRARLRQVLQNLLTNALRHTPANGVITVRAARMGQMATLSVRDTGDGITPEHLPLIFNRFYRTDPARTRDSGGAGLGLAIVRALVEAHGGTVSVHSDGRNRGSTFTVRLPLL